MFDVLWQKKSPFLFVCLSVSSNRIYLFFSLMMSVVIPQILVGGFGVLDLVEGSGRIRTGSC